jgi:hypothetical protein
VASPISPPQYVLPLTNQRLVVTLVRRFGPFDSMVDKAAGSPTEFRFRIGIGPSDRISAMTHGTSFSEPSCLLHQRSWQRSSKSLAHRPVFFPRSEQADDLYAVIWVGYGCG